jgi:hypothetical protein
LIGVVFVQPSTTPASSGQHPFEFGRPLFRQILFAGTHFPSVVSIWFGPHFPLAAFAVVVELPLEDSAIAGPSTTALPLEEPAASKDATDRFPRLFDLRLWSRAFSTAFKP